MIIRFTKEIKYKDIKYYDSGQLLSAHLWEDSVIKGVKYKVESYISFWSNGQVMFSTLAENTKINGDGFSCGI